MTGKRSVKKSDLSDKASASPTVEMQTQPTSATLTNRDIEALARQHSVLAQQLLLSGSQNWERALHELQYSHSMMAAVMLGDENTRNNIREMVAAICGKIFCVCFSEKDDDSAEVTRDQSKLYLTIFDNSEPRQRLKAVIAFSPFDNDSDIAEKLLKSGMF